VLSYLVLFACREEASKPAKPRTALDRRSSSDDRDGTGNGPLTREREEKRRVPVNDTTFSLVPQPLTERRLHVKKLIIASLFCLSACEFNAAGLPYDETPDAGDETADGGTDAGTDAGGADAAPMPDATVCAAGQVLTQDGCQAIPTITCSLASSTEIRMRFEGYLAAGFLGDAPSGATPVAIAYGSAFDSADVMASCDGAERWIIPYPSDCAIKPLAAWTGGEPATVDLVISKTAENINVALVYDDGTVRWGDLTELEPVNPDPDGFVVSGSGSGYSCHIQHIGDGGLIKIAP